MVQYPAVKPGVALVLIGGKGVGKDSLIEYAGGMLRPKNYVNMDTPTHLTGNFNAHLETCLLGGLLHCRFWQECALPCGRIRQ